MKAKSLYKSISKVVATYKAKLAAMDDDNFTVAPPIGGWSFSEVYSHIFDSSLLSLIALHNASKGEGENRTTAFAVKLILFFGALPPGRRYEVPGRLKERAKKINMMAAHQFITDFELQLAKIYPALQHANPSIKVKHPRMGYLNAKQWLRFIEIHLKHHLKQINRIEKSFQQER